MADIFGHRLPEGKVTGTLAAIGIVSIPLALLAGVGYGAYALVQRIRRPETPEEQLERLQKAAYNRFPAE